MKRRALAAILLFVVGLAAFVSLHALINLSGVVATETPASSLPTLIRIEQEWWEAANENVGRADLDVPGLRCWRVPAHDFPGQMGAWECWRCTVLEGEGKGTIRWEWRAP